MANIKAATGELKQVLDERDILRARVTTLEYVLRPFVRGSYSSCHGPDDNRCGSCSVCKAQAALEGK